MYDLICDSLEAMGFLHYEISNFALPGYECKHYLLYHPHGVITSLVGIEKAIEHYRIALELTQGKAPWAEDARERIRR